jgi:hypothetical protein
MEHVPFSENELGLYPMKDSSDMPAFKEGSGVMLALFLKSYVKKTESCFVWTTPCLQGHGF